MNYDKILQNICFGKNRINIWKINKILHNCTNIKKYLLNRFEYVESIQESLYRIKNNIEIRPVCPVCGKYVKFLGLKKKGFTYHCSQYCSNNDLNTINKSKQSSLRKYGVDNYSKTKEHKERVKQTCLEKYGREIPFNYDKSKETCLEKYGVDNYFKTKEFIEKRKQTCLEKYGVENYNNKEKGKQTCLEKYGQTSFNKKKEKQTCLEKYGDENYNNPEKRKQTCLEKYGREIPFNYDKAKETCLKKYGVDNYSKTKEFKDRVKETNLNKFGVSTPLLLEKSRNKRFSKEIIDNVIDTKRKNHTFNTSKLEEELYLYIKEKFPSVIRQYKDKERYPFCCDFYIPELDLFLELNGTWTHGKHPFNINSKEDISILNTWKEKSKEHPFYLSAIETWTIRDVKKRNKAKEENLNFHEFWNIEETKQFIDEL